MTTPTRTQAPQPLYNAARMNPAYQLRYSWTGWPSKGNFEQTPIELLTELHPLWKTDGLRLLEFRWTKRQIQLLFSTEPRVSPEFLARRAKGRLDHAIRAAGLKMPLSRKLGVRSVGNNVTRQVEAYIERQVGRAQFFNDQFESFMVEFTVVNQSVNLTEPSATKRGRYWYNLHIVLVTVGRYRVVDKQRLTTIRDHCLAVAAKKTHLISRLSVMPDHLHLALRGNPAHSPNEIVDGFLNNVAYALGQQRLWHDSFYAGTFSEYNIEAIRRKFSTATS